MKILIISTVKYELNGISNVIKNIYCNSEFDGLDISFLFPTGSDRHEEEVFIDRGFKVYHYNRKNIISYLIGIYLIIKRNRINVVHIHGNSHTVAIELFAAWLAGCKVRIVHAHSSYCTQVLAHLFLTSLFHVLCTHRIACSDRAGRFMFGNRPFYLLKNSIDVNKFAFNPISREHIRRRLGIKDEIVLGHVGLLSEIKNQVFLLDVFEKLVKNSSDYKLILIGDGPHESLLKETIKDYNLNNNVYMLGAINNVNEYLSAFDIFLMPSLFEGFPLTMLECQANGLPCIISDTITKEVDITNLVARLSLDAGFQAWIDKILDVDIKGSRHLISKDAIVQIERAGYSIDDTAKSIYKWYKDISISNEKAK